EPTVSSSRRERLAPGWPDDPRMDSMARLPSLLAQLAQAKIPPQDEVVAGKVRPHRATRQHTAEDVYARANLLRAARRRRSATPPPLATDEPGNIPGGQPARIIPLVLPLHRLTRDGLMNDQTLLDLLRPQLDELKQKGLYKRERQIQSPQG